MIVNILSTFDTGTFNRWAIKAYRKYVALSSGHQW